MVLNKNDVIDLKFDNNKFYELNINMNRIWTSLKTKK